MPGGASRRKRTWSGPGWEIVLAWRAWTRVRHAWQSAAVPSTQRGQACRHRHGLGIRTRSDTTATTRVPRGWSEQRLRSCTTGAWRAPVGLARASRCPLWACGGCVLHARPSGRLGRRAVRGWGYHWSVRTRHTRTRPGRSPWPGQPLSARRDSHCPAQPRSGWHVLVPRCLPGLPWPTPQRVDDFVGRESHDPGTPGPCRNKSVQYHL
jgi:hypothetical protein